MLYSTLRKNIRTGDAFFTSSETLISRSIRFFTRSRVSHTGIFFWQGGRLMIFEMLTSGGHIAFASEYFEKISKNTTIYWGRIRHKKGDTQILQRIQKLSTMDYDYLGAVSSALGGKNIESRYFCSEAVADILGLYRSSSLRSFTPDDLAEKTESGIWRIEMK